MPEPGPSNKSISGAFNPKSFKKVLSALERNGYVGCLQVSKGEATKFIYFTVGGVRLHVTGAKQKIPIGKLLIRYGKVKPSQLDDAVTIQRRTGKRMGEVLTKFMKITTTEDMLEMILIQVENEIVDLITWDGGAFQFHDKMPDDLFDSRHRATTISMEVEELVERLLKRIDDWEGIQERVPDMRGAYKLTPAGEEELSHGKFAGFWLEFANLLDGRRNLLEMIDMGSFGIFETCEITAELLDRECIIKVVSGSDEFDEARDVFEEITLLERALEVSGEDEVLRFRLATAFETSGQKEKAAAQYRVLGELKLANYHLDEAVEVLDKALKLNPNDFDAHEILFDILRRHDPDRAETHGIRLAEIYRTNRLFNRTKNILLQILDMAPKSVKARRILAEVYTTLDEVKPAVVQYEHIAVLLKEEKKDEARLRDIYEKILILDESHRFARKELKRLYFRGVREVGRILRILIVGVVAVAAAAAVLYEFWARIELGSLQTDVKTLVEDGRIDEARSRARTFQKTFFLTSTVSHIDDIVRALDSRERNERNQRILKRIPLLSDALSAGRVEEIRRGREECEEVLASTDFFPEVRARVLGLSNRLADFLSEYREFGDAVDRGDHSKAFERLKSLLRTNRTLVPDKHYRLQFPLEVTPRDASVFAAGVLWKNDFIQLSLEDKTPLRFEFPGYATVKMNVSALDAAWPLTVEMKKRVQWKRFLGGPVSLTPAVRRNDLIVVTDANRLTSLVGESGHARKTLQLDAARGLVARPLWRGDRLYCPHVDGSFSVIDTRSLSVLVRADAGGPLVSSPVEITAPKPGFLVLRADGTLLLWNDDTSAFTRLASLDTGVEPGAAYGEDVLVAGSTDGRLIAYDLKLGRIKWTADLEATIVRRPVVAKAVVYAATRAGDLWALSLLTGKPLRGWPHALGAAYDNGPAVAADRVYIGSPDKHIYAFDRTTGRLEWKLHVGGPVSSTPTLHGSLLFAGTADGRLVALDTVRRKILWDFPTAGAVRTQPCIVGKTVVFGSEDGFLYAIWE